MISEKAGTNILKIEVTNIDTFGIWIFINGKRIFSFV